MLKNVVFNLLFCLLLERIRLSRPHAAAFYAIDRTDVGFVEPDNPFTAGTMRDRPT